MLAMEKACGGTNAMMCRRKPYFSILNALVSIYTVKGSGSPLRKTLDSKVAISLPSWLVMSIW